MVMVVDKSGKMVRAGDRLRWTSQSGGFYVERTGQVIDVVPIGSSAYLKLAGRTGRRRFDTDQNWVSDRVLVQVERISKRDGRVLGYDYYCPYASVVEVVRHGEECEDQDDRA